MPSSRVGAFTVLGARRHLSFAATIQDVCCARSSAPAPNEMASSAVFPAADDRYVLAAEVDHRLVVAGNSWHASGLMRVKNLVGRVDAVQVLPGCPELRQAGAGTYGIPHKTSSSRQFVNG